MPTKDLDAIQESDAEDINYLLPQFPISVSRVGIVNIREQICALVDGRPYVTIGTFNVFTDLPSRYRAVHMSRSVEALHKVLWTDEGQQPQLAPRLPEEICPTIVDELLQRHEYAGDAFVTLEFDLFLSKAGPTQGADSREMYRIGYQTRGVGRRPDQRLTHSLEVEVVGATTCPCAQNHLRHEVLSRFGEATASGSPTPYPTHMQRTVTCLRLESPNVLGLSLRELIDVAENAMSSSTYGLLKRGDEAAVIRSAFNRPRFVEDVVRLAAEEVARRWHPQISAKITVRAEAQESIHKHNSFAEITGTIDQIHDQLKVPTHGHVK